MKTRKTNILSLTACFLLVALRLSAIGYSVGQVPNAQLHDSRSFVSNPDGILSRGTVAAIDSMLWSLKARGIAQVAVIVIDSMSGDDNYFFAHDILNSWGVGEKGKDNGLVILVAKSQREIQVETGYGLESILPDALCSRIENSYMIPYLSQGEWDRGVLGGVEAFYRILDGQSDSVLEKRDGELPYALGGFMVIMMLVTILGSAIISHIQKKCPRCKKQGLGLESSNTISHTLNYTLRRNTYRCRYCGYNTQKIVKIPRHIYIGGGPRGNFPGGGFGGGSWGGGMSGGGGARGRF